MCKNLTAFAKKYGRAALLAVSALGTASCLPLLLSRPLRDAIVSYGSRLAGKQINAPFWDEWLFRTGLKYFALFAYVLVLTIFWKQVVSFVKYVLQNSKTLHICILVLTALTVFNSFRSLNIPVSGITLDPSWIWAINKIPHIDNFIFGRDAVFTYGPLGFIFMPADYASHIALSFFANIVCVTLLIISLKGTFKKLPAEQKLFFSLPVFLFIPFTSFEWLWNITLFVCAANCFQNRQNRRFYLWISVFAALSGVSLVIKFNTAVLAGAMAFMLGVALLFADIKKTLAYAALFAVMYCSVTLLNIGMLFKDIRNFLLWFRMSLEVAGGFSYAMAINGSVPLALFAIAVIICYCVFIKKTYKRDTDLLALFLLGFPVMFFSFKHGFVRQDGHMSNFFTACPLLLALILLHAERTRPKFRRFFTVVSAVSLMYHFIAADIGVINYSRNLYYAIKLPHNLVAFEQRKKDAHAANALPDEWNEIIGANTIQILPWELSYAQANNWAEGANRWQPNPVFQLYSVYTKTLDEYSAASFSPERAPEFILLEWNAIDGRNMFLDTPAVWNAVLPNYHIAKSDGTRLLLQKNTDQKTLALAPFKTEKYTWNQSIPIPEYGEDIYAKITIAPSVLGKIITFFFRGNPPKTTLTTKSGASYLYRAIAGTLQTPALASRVPNTFEQMRTLFAGEPDDAFAVTELRFTSHTPFLYKKAITIEWLRAEK